MRADVVDLASTFVEHPFGTPSVTTRGGDLVGYLLYNVGATLARRDALDRRIVELIRHGEDRLLDSQADVGGWRHLEGGVAPLDSDGDGMPDESVVARGREPHDPAEAHGDPAGDGYTNLEEYLNGTDPFGDDHR